VILGISKDSLKSHARFAEKNELNFPLISDPDKEVHERYDVIKEKSMYGKKVLGTERSTFLIDGENRIRGIWRKVKVAGHAEEVLEAVKAMK